MWWNNRKDVRNNAGNKGAGGNERNNWQRNNIILVRPADRCCRVWRKVRYRCRKSRVPHYRKGTALCWWSPRTYKSVQAQRIRFYVPPAFERYARGIYSTWFEQKRIQQWKKEDYEIIYPLEYYEKESKKDISMDWLIKKRINLYVELLPKFSAHVMRHTACTRMAGCRMDVKVLQYIMGHAHIDVTKEVYNHIGELTRIEKEIARLDSMALNAWHQKTKIGVKLVSKSKKSQF